MKNSLPLTFVLAVALGLSGCATVATQRAAPDAAAVNQEQLQARLASARTALASNRPEDALDLLSQQRDSVPQELLAPWTQLRAQAFEQRGDGFQAAGERAILNAAQSGDTPLRGPESQAIDRLLASVPDVELSRLSAALPTGHPLYPFAGRALTRRGLPLPRPYDRVAAPRASADRPPADTDGYRPPRKMAVLLPLTGSLASAGGAVRDGLLTAYYAESRRRPELVFLDTATGADAAYRQAVAAGVNFVVGPLAREDVGKVFADPAAGVPVLALNRSASPPPPGSYGFSLAPEDEGIAAADRLLGRGLRRVIAVTGNDDAARRSLAAFVQRLGEGGGSVAGQTAIGDGATDYGPALRAALAGSGGRYDALFVALKAPQARLLVPQLAPSGLIRVPILATSLILAGGGDPRLDKELDGIQYPELPWMLGTTYGLPDASATGSRIDTARGAAARLFAFGMDAWKLAAYLDHLAVAPGSTLRAATGELSLDGFGNVQRTPAWATFSGGRPRAAGDGGLISQPAELERMPGAEAVPPPGAGSDDAISD